MVTFASTEAFQATRLRSAAQKSSVGSDAGHAEAGGCGEVICLKMHPLQKGKTSIKVILQINSVRSLGMGMYGVRCVGCGVRCVWGRFFSFGRACGYGALGSIIKRSIFRFQVCFGGVIFFWQKKRQTQC